jgi:glycosyltransferase involved in cell wall biosynthesis
MLERLLRSLSRQETGGAFDVSIVVVDNDVAGSARETALRLREELGLDLTYAIEPERTIPAVRNHALRLARGNYIGIVDDDEFAPPRWLLTLYRAIRSFGVDGALGPVHPWFDQEPPRWLIRSRLCERPTHPTGTLLRWDQTRTGNVLVRREVFDRHGLRFDPTYRTGGSDREFFKQAMRRGHRFVAVEEAPVHEVVPPERWTRRYWIRRALVNGFNAHGNAGDGLRAWRRPAMACKLLAATLACLAAAPVCACLGTAALMRCAVSGGHHFSRLCAMLGIELVKRRDF